MNTHLRLKRQDMSSNKKKEALTETISHRQLEIIEAAGRLLTNSGVSGLTIKNLAKEMGFSESALYRHFTSKEEIIVALLTYLADLMNERLTRLIKPGSNSEEKFRQLFGSMVQIFNEHPHFVVAVFSDGLMEESQKINVAILKIMAVNMKHLMPIIKEGQQKKIFTNAVTTEDLVHVVMASFRLQMFKWRASHFKFNLEKAAGNIISSLLILIKEKQDS